VLHFYKTCEKVTNIVKNFKKIKKYKFVWVAKGLKERRKKLCITLERLSKASHISVSYLHLIENGRRKISEKKARQIERALDWIEQKKEAKKKRS